MRLKVTCACGKEISTSDAAKVLRAGNKTKLTSEQAKAMRKKRKTWRKKTIAGTDFSEPLDLLDKL